MLVLFAAPAADAARPDLRVASLTRPAGPVAPGAMVTVRVGVVNRGARGARRSRTHLLLSRDRRVGAGGDGGMGGQVCRDEVGVGGHRGKGGDGAPGGAGGGGAGGPSVALYGSGGTLALTNTSLAHGSGGAGGKGLAANSGPVGPSALRIGI